VSVGRSLFDALFSTPEAASFLRQARSRIRREEETELLRLRLRMPPHDPHLRDVAFLPWELLHDGEDFLCLGRGVTVVRHLDMPTPREPIAATPPLSLLLVAASPGDLRRLDVESEGDGVLASWRESGRIEVDCLTTATWEALRDRLHRSPVHALHFMGHGAFDERSASGAIVLHSVSGHEAVDGEELRRLARDVPSLRLVVLNACDTGLFDPGAGADVFAGAAIALAQGGVSAVIAMQLPIADRAAILFGQVLHQRLSQGERLEWALVEARVRLHRALPGSWDWMAPVLFMRCSDGHLLQPTAVEEVEETPLHRSNVALRIGATELTGTGRTRITGAAGRRHKGDQISVEIDQGKLESDEIEITGWTDEPRSD